MKINLPPPCPLLPVSQVAPPSEWPVSILHLEFHSNMGGVLAQWLKLPAWKVGDRWFEPHPGLQVLQEQNVSSQLTRKYLILWGASVTES